MRRGVITSASDQGVSLDRQPSQTHGGAGRRAAKPTRAKRSARASQRITRLATRNPASNSIPSNCLWFDSTLPLACEVYPRTYPTSMCGARERRPARLGAGSSIPPQAKISLSQTIPSKLTSPCTPAVAAGLKGPAEARFAALKAWRAEVARAHNLPACVISHDATLAAAAAAAAALAPQSLSDLQCISGIGAAKLEKYGSEVLRVMAT